MVVIIETDEDHQEGDQGDGMFVDRSFTNF